MASPLASPYAQPQQQQQQQQQQQAVDPGVDVFVWHTRDITNGSLLMDYNIEKVESVSASPDSPTQLRTLVVFATHKKYPLLQLAIKITPIYLQGRREDFVREQQIHYLLTQLDAEAVRKAAADKTAKDKTLFVATREQPLEHEVTVINAIVDTTHHNVVPLYDFVIQSFNISMIPQVTDRAKLSPFAWLSDHPASILVQSRLNGTLYDLVQKKRYPLVKFISVLRYVIIQVCCMLHSLMVIKFTHGDTHPRNIGWIDKDLERHYHVTKKRVFVIPSDVPTTMLLDFDNSRAEMKDATGKPFKMIPSATSLGARFRGVVKLTPDQTFSPMVDIFRLVHGVMRLLARQMLAKDANFDNVVLSPDTLLLGTACRDGMTNIPQSIKEIAAYKTASGFYEALLDLSKTDETLKEAAGALDRDREQQETLWYRLYAATPSTIKETTVYTMPWDVLKKQDPVDPGVRSLDGSVNLTLSPLYKPRKVYQPANVDVIPDSEIRVHPLKAAFPREFQ